MVEQHHMAIQSDLSVTGDDLKLIRGVRLALERRFHEAGIHTFAQIAEMTPAELAVYFSDLPGLSAHRIEEKDWIGQARELQSHKQVGAPLSGHLVQASPANGVPEKRLHYAVFTVELLLDNANRVQRTRVQHVQSQNEGVWAGWDGARLANFLADEGAVAGLSMGLQAGQAPAVESTKQTKARIKPEDMKGALHVGALKVVPQMDDFHETMVRSDLPLQISMMVDFSHLQSSPPTGYTYKVSVYAQRLSSPGWRLIGSTEGLIKNGEEKLELKVEGQGLPGGAYRLVALVMLIPPDDGHVPAPNLMAMTESGTLQVY